MLPIKAAKKTLFVIHRLKKSLAVSLPASFNLQASENSSTNEPLLSEQDAITKKLKDKKPVI